MVGTLTLINQESAFGHRTFITHWDTELGPNPSQIRTLVALNGDSVAQTANSVVLLQRFSGASNLILKGVAGDTGIPLRATDPTVFCPLTSYVVNTTSASDVTIIEA